MPTVTDIKEELEFNNELMDLLEVMKNIAIFHFHALQEKKRRFARFTEELKHFLRMFDLNAFDHPFVKPRVSEPCTVMITSDEGFMGGLNMDVINTALAEIPEARGELVIVGERGARYLTDMGRKFTAFRGAAGAEGRYKLALELKDHILKAVRDGRLGAVSVFYPKPVSFLVQKVEVMRLLPIPPSSSDRPQSLLPGRKDIIIESPLEGILDFLAEKEILENMVDILEDSKLSEFASRAIHLEKSNRTLTDKQKELRFKYLRAYHGVIDKNIRELFAAQVIRGRR